MSGRPSHTLRRIERQLRFRRAIAGAGASVIIAASCGSASDDATAARSTTTATTSRSPTVEEAEDCASLAIATVAALQEYVDTFEGVRADMLGTYAERGQADLAATSAALRARIDQLGCTRAQLADHLGDELPSLTGTGPVAEGVAATFRAGFLGTEDPSDRPAVTVEVRNATELSTAVATAGSGSTIRLAGGSYELDRTLLLFRPLTLDGSGANVEIVSAVEGATVLSMVDGVVTMRDLAVRHSGDAQASVVVVRSGQLRLDGVEITGGQPTDDLEGGYGLLLRTTETDDRTTIVDSVVRDNPGGGIVVGGTSAPTMRGLTIEDNGVCGVCWVEDSGGTLEDAVVRGHVLGVQAAEDASPTIRSVSIERSSTAAALLADRSRAVLAMLSCGESPSDVVVVTDDAVPELDGAIGCPIVRSEPDG